MKGTGTTTEKKNAGPEPFAGLESTMLMLNSASPRDWHIKAGLYSTSDAFPRARWFGQEWAKVHCQ